ncbi:hypothetical protein GH733_006014 [Mirounga leonina]|nr:hypothetical protein GH733_006014 [Mirounga leonina]
MDSHLRKEAAKEEREAATCVVSSDDEELSRDRDVYVTTHTPRNTREEAATGLSCPICMDGYSECVHPVRSPFQPQQKLLVLPVAPGPSGTAPDLHRPMGSGVWGPSNPLGLLLPGEWLLPLLIVQNGRLIVSTECGHVFCSQCLRDSLKNANTCPTCRKKINHKRYHPIYI